MSMVERDYVLRMIQQLSQALARILGLRREGKLDEALAAARETADGIFGPLRLTIDALDAQSAAGLLGSREKITAYAALTREEGEIHGRKGDLRRARASGRRALALYLEAAILGPGMRDEDRAAVQALSANVDEAQLAARYRDALAAL